MKPYYQDNYVTIIHGDSREILPNLGRFDVLLTDPPYGMNWQSNHRKQKLDKIIGDNSSFPVDFLITAMDRIDSAAYIFCRWENISEMPKPKSIIAWVKNNWSTGDLKHEHGRQWEACLFYPKIEHKFIKRISDVIFANRTGNHLHPTEKPILLLKQIISANVCETIIDPFAGSGTTGRAAKDLGKKVVLIEIQENYCEVSAKRMMQEVLTYTD